MEDNINHGSNSLSKMQAIYNDTPGGLQDHNHYTPDTLDLVRFTLSTLAVSVYLTLAAVSIADLKGRRKTIHTLVKLTLYGIVIVQLMNPLPSRAATSSSLSPWFFLESPFWK